MVDSGYLALFFRKNQKFSKKWSKWSKIVAHSLFLHEEFEKKISRGDFPTLQIPVHEVFADISSQHGI